MKIGSILKTNWFACLAVLAVVIPPDKSVAQTASKPMTTMQYYAFHDSLGTVAQKAGDWTAFRTQVMVIDSILNGHAVVQVLKARAAAHLGDTAAAYANLRRFASMGLFRRIEADVELKPLVGTPSWDRILATLKSNAAPVGSFSPAFTMPDSDFVAEDVTYDAKGKRFFVTGIRRSTITEVTPAGSMRTFASAIAPGWGMLAVAADPANNTLWASAEPLSFSLGYDSTQKGHSAVLRYELSSGKLLQRYDMPTDVPHGSGDIGVAENGDLFISDGTAGAIYVIRKGKPLEVLTAPGELRSPQGPAVSSDGKHIYVADYSRGLARVDRATGAVVWLQHPENVALNGIDGLSTAGPSTLIGVQNGTNPNRLIRITLDPTETRVLSVVSIAQNAESIREPTHGVFVGNDYYFIANGGFGAFGDDGNLRKGERAIAPVIMRMNGVR